jgi:hypothetical protein
VFTFTHNLAPGAARAQLGGGERTAAPAWQGRNTRFIYWYIGGCSLFAKPSFPRTRSRRPPRLEFLPKFAAAPFSRLAVAAAPATQSGGRLVRGYIRYIIPGSAVLHTCVAYYIWPCARSDAREPGTVLDLLDRILVWGGREIGRKRRNFPVCTPLRTCTHAAAGHGLPTRLHRSLKNTDTTQSAGAGQGKQLMTVDYGGP